MMDEFSFKTRQKAIEHFKTEKFDLLIIGGGIVGAATARDAVSRGLKVALVERKDFAFGTSSRSSKLIHGGLRYLQSAEFHLVFEALAERKHLMDTAPYRVKYLPFYVPNYEGDKKGRFLIGAGLWLYDLLAIFRTKEWHRHFSKKDLLRDIPILKEEGLKGGYRYYDASMQDDVIVIDTLRAAHQGGAAIANYVEALAPIWKEDKVAGFRLKDHESVSKDEFELKAKRVVVCGGPWTDELGSLLSPNWKRILTPSKGVHLVFDLKRLPLPGAMMMVHPQDGRIAFVMARPDLGTGVTIVGTTDSPAPQDPDMAKVNESDIDYLMDLLWRYFPSLRLTKADIISTYVGIRPLMNPMMNSSLNSSLNSTDEKKKSLQDISREYYIALGPGQTVLVAGGKYTTHRQMAKEIVDFTLKAWKISSPPGSPDAPPSTGASQTSLPVNSCMTAKAVEKSLQQAKEEGIKIPSELIERFGSKALDVIHFHNRDVTKDPEGFPCLAAQLEYTMKHEMVLHLEDFYLRRVPLFLTRADGGLPWADGLSHTFAKVKGVDTQEAVFEVFKLRQELSQRLLWKN